MPHWDAAVACALRVASNLPEVATLGLDVAITATGPVLIEVNTNWGQNLTQAPGPTGLVQGTFRRFLEERNAGAFINLAARS
jgi:glutathione synthase/RimK-type ligase-like ATP-grasp enzyme